MCARVCFIPESGEIAVAAASTLRQVCRSCQSQLAVDSDLDLLIEVATSQLFGREDPDAAVTAVAGLMPLILHGDPARAEQRLTAVISPLIATFRTAPAQPSAGLLAAIRILGAVVRLVQVSLLPARRYFHDSYNVPVSVKSVVEVLKCLPLVAVLFFATGFWIAPTRSRHSRARTTQ